MDKISKDTAASKQGMYSRGHGLREQVPNAVENLQDYFYSW